MKPRRSVSWSLLVMRGPDRKVKQFRVSKRSIVAAPAACVLVVSGCVAGLELRSAYQIDQLEGTLASQANAHRQAIHLKEGQIEELQDELARAVRQANDMNTKLTDLQALEAKLKQFTEVYGATVQPSYPVYKEDAASVRESDEQAAYSADKEAAYMARLALESNLDFKAVSTMVDAMEKTMSESLRQAKQRQAELDALPSGWPTISRTLTSSFGYRTDPFTGRSTFHAGIDIGGEPGDPVFAAGDGLVTETGSDSSKGNYIVITHSNGLQTVYYHLKRITAKLNDSALRGDKIGELGSTGRSTAPHLHFQIMQKDEAVNPLPYLRLVKED